MRQGINFFQSQSKKLCILIWLCLLTACAGQVNILPSLSEETATETDKGVVVARIISAGSYPLPFNQFTITPENLNASEEIKPERMISYPPKQDGTTVFAATANPGNYSLSSIRAFYTVGDGWYSHFVSSDPELGTFSVKPGQVTDLGTLIYYPKSFGDKYVETLLRLPEEPSGEVLDKFFSFYKYDKNQILTWDYDGRDEDRQVEYLSALQNSVNYPNQYLAPDGSIYFLAKLGVIIKRTKDGNWELDAVDTNFDLNTIVQNSQGDIIVGGAEGKLFLKRNDGEWLDISLTFQDQIAHLRFVDDQTFNLVSFDQTKVTVQRVTINSESLDWQEVNTYDSITGWKTLAYSQDKQSSSLEVLRTIESLNLFDIADESYISINTHRPTQDPVFATKTTKTFSYQLNDWSVAELQKKPEFTSVVDAGAIKMAIKEPGFWSFIPKLQFFRYIDNEDRWDQISTRVNKCGGVITDATSCTDSEGLFKKSSFEFKSIPWFQSKLDALAIAQFSNYNLWTGDNSSEIKILKTIDGGKTWTDKDVSLPKDFCSTVVPAVKDRMLISCDGFSGDFYETFDEGETWNHVRQHENF